MTYLQKLYVCSNLTINCRNIAALSNHENISFCSSCLSIQAGRQIEQFFNYQKCLQTSLHFLLFCVCSVYFCDMEIALQTNSVRENVFMSLAQSYYWKAVDSSTVTYCGDFWQKSFVVKEDRLELGWKIRN
jgi:hypothetical protein